MTFNKAIHLKDSWAPNYTGPGDIASGAVGWYGLRAYNAAFAASLGAAADITDQAGANLLTLNVKSDGTLDTSPIAAWQTAHSVTSIKMAQLYDQSGHGAHMASNNGRSGGFPDLTLNKLGSLPAMRFGIAAAPTAIAQSVAGTAAYPYAQPYFISTVYQQRTTNGTTQSIVVGFNGPIGLLNLTGAAGDLDLYAGATTGISGITDGVFHAVQALFNDTSSSLYVDGTANTGLSPGTGAFSNGGPSLGSDNTTFRWLDGWMCEAGIWPSDQTSHNAALDSNQRTYWGF